MYLDENLFRAHHLDDLANVRAGLLQEAQLFPEQPYPRVVVIALSFETTEDGLTLEDLELHRLDLVVIVIVERHDDGGLRCVFGASSVWLGFGKGSRLRTV